MQKSSQRTSDIFSQKYSLYGNMLFRICIIYLGNKEDAEEAMQESFLKLMYNSPQFTNDEHEKAWLIRIATNICKDMLRSVWHKRVVKMDNIVIYYDNPSDIHIVEEILKLPAKYKAVIILHYFEDYTVKHISETLGILAYNSLGKNHNTPLNVINSTGGIYVSKIELPKKTNAQMNMIGLFVYKGRVYTQTGTKISPESAENLLGEKLGTTKGNIDEWSQQDDYAVEFASSVGKQDVYTVRGYDKNFRLMTFEKSSGTINAQFYECLNGITVKTGADVFTKLNIDDRIKIAKFENFESWNNNKQQYKVLTNLNGLNNLVTELKNTIPYSQESLSYLFDDDKRETNQKFVYITLNDGSEVQLRLFKDGYIYYGCCHIFFKMNNQAFNKLWNELE